MHLGGIRTMTNHRRIYYDPVGILEGRIPSEVADEFEFVPFCTREGQAVWREVGKTPFDIESLVAQGFERLLDIARRLANGESVNYWALPNW
jgi:hypothetical protein